MQELLMKVEFVRAIARGGDAAIGDY